MNTTRDQTSTDRTVHARCAAYEVVRYDRSGKWWIEWASNSFIPARQVSVSEAATFAIQARDEEDGSVEFGKPGGSRFDSLVRRTVGDST